MLTMRWPCKCCAPSEQSALWNGRPYPSGPLSTLFMQGLFKTQQRQIATCEGLMRSKRHCFSIKMHCE